MRRADGDGDPLLYGDVREEVSDDLAGLCMGMVVEDTVLMLCCAGPSLGFGSLNLPPNQSRVARASRETRFQIISGCQ
jgi:hypothetical protein